jgi:uncharacterized phage protein (TIGR01671 family)
MREIKFRGMDIDGKWYQGNLAVLPDNVKHLKKGHYISNAAGLPFAYQVRPETVSQYTVLKDKDGKEIYEGDILRVLEITNNKNLEYVSPVEFTDLCYLVTEPSGCQVPLACFDGNSVCSLFEIEVIGNVYEHPHLLEVSK